MHPARYAIPLMLVLPGVATAAKGPVAVSPGTFERSSPIEARCPTFSWGSLPRATSYELVVFEVEEGAAGAVAADAPLVLRTEISGTALSWTPASDRCLERGKRYAWSIRAKTRDAEGAWSEPRLFEVQRAPSVEEVEAALDTLRRYVERDQGGARGEEYSALAAALAASGGGKATPAAPAEPAVPAALPEGFVVGISSIPTAGAAGTVGVHGVSDSMVDQSAGVVGEALSGVGIVDGVQGNSASVAGTGVRGGATADSGVTAGVWGGALSPEGYGGFFLNLGAGDPGGAGVFASGAVNSSPDLVLGGSLFPEADQDDGRIHSGPNFPSSDIVLQSNDDVRVILNHDGDGDDSDFTVLDEDQIVFNVDHTGTTFIDGDLIITGDPGGGLVTLSDVALLIQEHLQAEHPKLVFVTSQTYDGNLGGLSGADQKCSTLALNAGLVGVFKAWISGDSTTEEARDRLTHADVPYRRLDYTKVADDWDDLTDDSLDAGITVDEHGHTVTTSLTAYTNTDSDGSLHENTRDCGPGPGQWNTNDNLQSGGYGTVGATNSNWSWHTNNNCSILRRLYCFQQ